MDIVLPILRVFGRAFLGLVSSLGILLGGLLSLGPLGALFDALGTWLFGRDAPAEGVEAAPPLTLAGIPMEMGADNALLLAYGLALVILGALGLLVALRGETADVLLERVRELEDRIG